MGLIDRIKSFFTKRMLTAFALYVVNLFAYLSYSLLAPFFPTEAKAIGMSETVIGLVFAAFAAVIFISSPICGKCCL